MQKPRYFGLTSRSPFRAPRSPLSPHATPSAERQVPERPAGLSDFEAGQCAILRGKLISLLNSPAVTYAQKQTGLDNLYQAAHYYGLAWLTRKEAGLRAKLTAPASTGRAGHTVCPECAAPVGYNYDQCGSCLAFSNSLAA